MNIASKDEPDVPVPPDQPPPVPVEEPPDKPLTEPDAPVREPGQTPGKQLKNLFD